MCRLTDRRQVFHVFLCVHIHSEVCCVLGCFLFPHPQQVPGDVALPVIKPRPPPLGLSLVTPAKHSEAVALAEGKLISLLGRVVPQSIDQAFVHDPQLLLYTCKTFTVLFTVGLFSVGKLCSKWCFPQERNIYNFFHVLFFSDLNVNFPLWTNSDEFY